ncbi:GNAT family N-acetyltransferase [Clostridium sp. SHJSY1]|uniref:GNAT family N-acetyltransferase n=1 Tax=Clostridium sp. SHJSY1 TaxID=2942483 RepID=UPI0028745C14|nr:GNAT family N-acetyltransferase [Clostridium sp. SHJSY1]MDS0526617.1 GNAT family N-acetyltransferase [Clostridium sp. SHJSY1]
MIRNVKVEDSKEIVDIYNYYILNTCITFDMNELSLKEMEEKIKAKRNKEPWIVYEEENKILGYAYVGEWRSKAAFNFTKEVTIYLNPKKKGSGIGTKLMEELIKMCKESGIRTLISVITVPNDISSSLHEKFGFNKVAYYEKVGFKQEKWLDVESWQLHI